MPSILGKKFSGLYGTIAPLRLLSKKGTISSFSKANLHVQHNQWHHSSSPVRHHTKPTAHPYTKTSLLQTSFPTRRPCLTTPILPPPSSKEDNTNAIPIPTGLVMMYGINSAADTLAQSTSAPTRSPPSPFQACHILSRYKKSRILEEKKLTRHSFTTLIAPEFKNDPRNPNSKTQKPADKR